MMAAGSDSGDLPDRSILDCQYSSGSSSRLSVFLASSPPWRKRGREGGKERERECVYVSAWAR